MLLEYIRKKKVKKVPEFEFEEIGKKSRAHDLASRVAHKKKKADITLSLRQIRNFAIKNDRASR